MVLIGLSSGQRIHRIGQFAYKLPLVYPVEVDFVAVHKQGLINVVFQPLFLSLMYVEKGSRISYANFDGEAAELSRSFEWLTEARFLTIGRSPRNSP